MKNTNLYKVLSKIDVIIHAITEDPTTTIEIAPVNYDDFDFDIEDTDNNGNNTGNDGSLDSDTETEDDGMVHNLFAEILDNKK